jgi:hypothetical protein
MRRTDWRGLAVVLALAACALTPAVAAAPSKPAPTDANTVSELIVTAIKSVSELTVTAKIKCLNPDSSFYRTSRPKVVSSFPAKGAVVRPGLLIVRVTFDQPMTCDGFFLADPPRQNPCPGSPQQMLLSYDRRTVRIACVVEPNAEYGLALSPDPNGKTFIGMSGLPSLPYQVAFTTSEGPPAATVCDSLSEDETTARQIRERHPQDCPGEPPRN